jgi:hypothetical protein
MNTEANATNTDDDHQFTNQSENPTYIAAHRVAFQTTEPPTNLKVGDHVWIIDHYYPGLVTRFDDKGRAVIQTWRDADEQDEFEYTPKEYKQLRVDPIEASRAFWPAPRGWNHIESDMTRPTEASARDMFPSDCADRD